jgi:hypothetical protein
LADFGICSPQGDLCAKLSLPLKRFWRSGSDCLQLPETFRAGSPLGIFLFVSVRKNTFTIKYII